MKRAVFNLRLLYPERESDEIIQLYNVYDLLGYFFVNEEENAAYFNFNCPDEHGNLCINEGIARETSRGILTGSSPSEDVSYFSIMKQQDGSWLGIWIQDGRESTFSIKPKTPAAQKRKQPESSCVY